MAQGEPQPGEAPGSPRPGGGTLYRSVASGDPAADPTPVRLTGAAADRPAGPDGTGAPETAGSTAGHSAAMAVGSLVSRFTGFIRTAVIAAALGGELIGDAYTTAQFFPGAIYELLLGGVLASVVVPALVRRRKHDPDGGEAYAQRLLTLTVLALGAATVLAVAMAPLLTMIYASDEATPAQRDLITTFSYLILPTIFFYGLAAILAAVLNTRGHFAAPMWTPILNNLVVIATAVLYLVLFGVDRALSPEQMTPARVLVIGGGTLLGIVVQSTGLWPALRKVGFRWRWRFDLRALGLRELGRLGAWTLCYVLAGQIGVLVVVNLLSRANKGGDVAGIMIYNNVFLLMMMAHGIVAVSIITALLPRMSAAAADGRFADVAADVSRGARVCTAVLAPIAVCYAVLAQPIMIVLFVRGAFEREHALSGSLVLELSALALIPFALSQLFVFAFYSMPDTKTPALINLPVVTLRVGVQILIFALFAASFTAAGLMVGNAVSYAFACLLSVVLLRRRVGRIGMARVVRTFAKVLVAAAVAAGAGLLTVRLLLGEAGAATAGTGANLLALVVGGLVICGSYGAVALVLRTAEVTEVFTMVRRRLGRPAGARSTGHSPAGH